MPDYKNPQDAPDYDWTDDAEHALERDVYNAAIADAPDRLRELLGSAAFREKAASRPGGAIDYRAGRGGWTPLMIAALEGHAECVRLLLPHSDAAAIDQKGRTAFMLAAFRGRPQVLQEPGLAARSDIHQRDFEGRTALEAAIWAGGQGAIEALAARPELSAKRGGGDIEGFEVARRQKKWGACEILAHLASREQLARLLESQNPAGFPRCRAQIEALDLRAELRARSAAGPEAVDSPEASGGEASDAVSKKAPRRV